GIYEVTHLNPGPYTVAAQSAGFKTFEHRDILLEARRTVRIDILLEVGEIKGEMTVMAGTPVIETESATISDLKTTRDIRDLPLNILNGVLLNAFLFTTPTGYQTLGSKFALGGARGTQLYYNIDGISANSPAFGVQNSPAEPTLESIQEMRFDIVNNRAEFGEVTNVTAITKSGTNEFHGSLYWLNSNNAYNARPFFADQKGQNIQNDLGFTLGGPIIENRTFFFGSYEAFRQRVPANLAPNLPTVKMRQGDFSELLNRPTPIVILNPFTGNSFPGNVVSSQLLNPTALKWQERFFPLPNFGPQDSTTANFRGTVSQQVQEDSVDVRVDHHFSPGNTIYARYGYKRLDNSGFVDSGVPPEFGGTRVNVRTGGLAAVSDTWTISPRLINEFKFGYAWGLNPREGSLGGQELIDFLGIQGLPQVSSEVRNIPSVNITGFHSIFQVAQADPGEKTFQLSDQITHVTGRHSIKAGGEYRPQQSNGSVQPMFGTYSFSNRFTGFAYSDFLLGLPTSTSRSQTRLSTSAGRAWLLSGFIQDDFRVSPKLTLSFGLRYDYNSPGTDKFDTRANFDPRTGSLVVPTEAVLREDVDALFPKAIPIVTAKQAGFPTHSLREADRNNFQPRLGFAYRPFGNTETVIRAGYGIFYDDLTLDLFSELGGAPFQVTEGFVNQVVGGQSLLTFTRPFLAMGTLGAVSVTALDLDLVNPVVQQWNLTVEQDVGLDMGLRLSYIGTRSSQVIYGRNINQPPPSTEPFSLSRRPYPLFQNVILRDNGANQSYHALSTELDRRFSGGLSFKTAWTWAKNITDANEVGRTEGGPTLENAFDRARERGNAQFSPRQRFVSSMIWQLPVGSGRRFLNQPGVLDWILGGWQLSTIYNYQTGEFLTPTFSGSDPSNTQTFGGIPDRIGDGNLPSGERSIDRWFDASAFARPPAGSGRFGNSGRNIIVGPGRQALNLGIFKSFRVTEGSSLRIQGTFTNVLNHPNFADPNLNISVPGSVGTIRGTRGLDSSGPRQGVVGIRFDF
ncbi:MAG: hypothetical protein DMG05_25195, partial [Acidobacteria bacterium]